jgi:hypothetical protein
LQYVSSNLVGLIEKVDIARCDYRLAKLFAKPDKAYVGRFRFMGLNLKIIIILCYFQNIFIRTRAANGSLKLACRTSGTD